MQRFQFIMFMINFPCAGCLEKYASAVYRIISEKKNNFTFLRAIIRIDCFSGMEHMNKIILN